MKTPIMTGFRSSCWLLTFTVYLVAVNSSTTAMAQTGALQVPTSEPRSPDTTTVADSPHGSRNPSLSHPDGDDLWDLWGIAPRVMTARERFDARSTATKLIGPRSKVADAIFLELEGKRPIDKARPLLDILGVEALPNDPEMRVMRVSDDQLRSIEGFAVSSALKKRPHAHNPDRIAFTHQATKQRTRVYFIYDNSPSKVMSRLLKSAPLMFSAPVGDVLPTCRINQGPGDVCWLGWARTNQERTLYFPSDADILFLRNGTGVLLFAEDAGEHASVMELARKIDALLLRQRTKGKKAEAPR